MPSVDILRDIHVECHVDSVRDILLDFKQWPAWSPWLIQEPECKLEYAEDGQFYSWDGHRIGKGSMRILDAGNHELTYDLRFLAPWKSSADVAFVLKEEDGGTLVSWRMSSKLPFFLFWMKKMMQTFVGMDYERGLGMLKAYAENKTVPSKLEFMGLSTFPGCRFLGIRSQISVAGVAATMGSDAKKLAEYLESIDTPSVGPMFSIYHKYDPVKDHVDYTIGLPVDDIPANIDSAFYGGNIAKLQAYRVAHVGDYQFLGNAWSALYAMERAKEIKCDKKSHPFELYMNMPGEVSDSELRTEIYFPVKQ